MGLTTSGLISRRGLMRGLCVAIIALALWLIVSWVVAYRLTRRPLPWFAEPAPVVSWGELESLRLKTRDGHELGAWLARGEEDAPSVLLLHGHKGSRKNSLDRAAMLAGQGCSVLLVSLRAHGDSTGDFDDIGFSARHDVIAAVDFLERQRPAQPIIVLGTSMGAAAAVFASGELAHHVHGYILECPYGDLKTAVWNRLENLLPPVFDYVAYQGLVLVAPLVLPDLGRISTIRAIQAAPPDVPVLILAGAEDRSARPDEVRALYRQVNSHGTLMMFPGAGHGKLHTTDPQRYTQALHGFVESVRR
jgi:alpha-beta hydrolase superfamily lysophospholipase